MGYPELQAWLNECHEQIALLRADVLGCFKHGRISRLSLIAQLWGIKTFH